MPTPAQPRTARDAHLTLSPDMNAPGTPGTAHRPAGGPGAHKEERDATPAHMSVTGLTVTDADRARFFAALDREPQYPERLAAMLGIENGWAEDACAPVTALLEHLVGERVLVRVGRPDRPAYATLRAARRADEEAALRARHAHRLQFGFTPPHALTRRCG